MDENSKYRKAIERVLNDACFGYERLDIVLADPDTYPGFHRVVNAVLRVRDDEVHRLRCWKEDTLHELASSPQDRPMAKAARELERQRDEARAEAVREKEQLSDLLREMNAYWEERKRL